MTGNSDNNRSEGQGGCREALSTKEVRNKGTTVGTRTGSEAEMRAMSVLENAKSNRHRKTHLVEPDGPGRKFMHLTRGDLPRESAGAVSKGRSSEEGRGNPDVAKGRRDRKAQSIQRLRRWRREVIRNRRGMATAAVSAPGERPAPGWIPRGQPAAGGKPRAGRRKEVNRCAKQ
jgi:hypothetical protein